ncbi:MAG: hypothetical protein R3C20_13185 [Planctomycetaceae bacterium]
MAASTLAAFPAAAFCLGGQEEFHVVCYTDTLVWTLSANELDSHDAIDLTDDSGVKSGFQLRGKQLETECHVEILPFFQGTL